MANPKTSVSVHPFEDILASINQVPGEECNVPLSRNEQLDYLAGINFKFQ